ncbi:heterokaryon incompatibility (het-6OR allele) [Pyrenophora seminiperda CCB06]|uniref:Heterokaryon incompatibility (Het-6OR allele) n=1 Tax=Pyrenophora seminiperda CCB06 TaxID=1302712 RepID=A0A3M7LXF1_9PLEO|nr:heterokaryon incompatibility (het-6OR allele) [Pyrenophora seminiperda CCB06]
MGIYTCGAKVLIWLGNVEPVKAFLNLDMLCQLAAEEDDTVSSPPASAPNESYNNSLSGNRELFPVDQEPPREDSTPHYRWYNNDRSCISLVTPDPSSSDLSIHKQGSLKNICPIFETHWFQRVWVIQEYIKSSSTEVFWGNASFSFELLGKAVTSVMGYHYSKIANYTEACTGMQSCFDIYRMRQDDGTTNTFFKTLLLTKDRKATDPRDKIFALVELPFCDRGEDTFFPLAPDYSLDVAEVYYITARRLLLERKEIDVLAYVKPGSLISENWPSWVPDWTHCRSPNAFAGRKVSAYTPAIIHEAKCRFCFNERYNSLSVGGIVVDRIDYLSADIFDRNPSTKQYGLRKLSRLRRSWLHAINAFINHFSDRFDEKTLAKSLTAGGGAHLVVLEGEDEEETFMTDYRNFAAYVKTREESARDYSETTNTFVNLVCNTVARRRFFVTESGMLG